MQRGVIPLAGLRVPQGLKCLVNQMERLLAATFVRMYLQGSFFEGKLNLIQGRILVHQQHLVQAVDHMRQGSHGLDMSQSAESNDDKFLSEMYGHVAMVGPS